MKNILLQIFTWWSGQTIGTRFHTWRHGTFVGEDEQGNRYYKYDNPKGLLGERRWVIYHGEAEASRVPPGWHAWMHHRVDTPPAESGYTPREWEKPHEPNRTGTPGRYVPRGSLRRPGARPVATGDYEPWTPN